MEIIAWLVNASVNTWISWISFLLCLCLIWMDFDYKARSKQYCRCVIVVEHCGKIIPGGPKITNVSSPMLENYAMVLFACITHITHIYSLRSSFSSDRDVWLWCNPIINILHNFSLQFFVLFFSWSISENYMKAMSQWTTKATWGKWKS